MHRGILSSLLIILVIVAGYFLMKQNIGPELDIRMMTGLPTNISDEGIEIEGAYSAAFVPEKLQSRRKLSFRTDENTVFKKQEIRMPPWPKLGPNSSSSGTYQLKDLPMTEGEGSLEDLRMKVASVAKAGDINVGSIYLEATFLTSIHEEENPVASEVFYKVFIEPAP